MISRATTVKIMLILLSAIVLFHVLVLIQVVPHEVVWGGKFEDFESMLPFEIVSIVLNLSFILLVRFRARKPDSKPGRIGMWLLFALFSLNTLGNLFAETMTEKLVFTPLTLILALLSLRLALKEK
jgi:hypothetical protein